MTRIVSLGECMVELAQTGPDTYRRGFAGDTFNAAWYARRLAPPETRVDYVTALGDDAVSGEMLAFFSAEGIGTRGIARIKGRAPGLYMISTEGGERSFAYWRGQSAARDLMWDPDHVRQAIKGAALLHFSGITLAILPPDDRAALCAMIDKARNAGTLVSFDTNLRPALWDGPDDMQRGIAAGAAVADLVLPSFDEDSALFADTDPAATVARYRTGGARAVVVKNGADPITVWTAEDGTQEIAPHPAPRIVDTTAAGDSFAGAMLAAMARGDGIAAAAALAAKLSARVIGAPGALVTGIFDDMTQGDEA